MRTGWEIEWTKTTAYLRRIMPGHRMQPNEVEWLHKTARDLMEASMGRGCSVEVAGEIARGRIFLVIFHGERMPS